MSQKTLITKDYFVFDKVYGKWHATIENTTIELYTSVGWYSSIYSEYVMILSTVHMLSPMHVTEHLGAYYEEETQIKEQDANALLEWGVDTLNTMQTFFKPNN